jgi:YD repeat-containing protein
MWMTEDGRTISSAFYYGITRDNLGRIVSGQYDEGGEQSWVYDSQGRRTEFTDIFWDGGETHTYTYDDNDLVLVEYVEMIGMDVEWNDNYTLTYSNYVLDDHDNWISRTRRVTNDGSTSTETRVITYYE